MNFYMPVRLITGENCVRKNAAELRAFGIRCLLVTGAHSAQSCGALDDVIPALKEAGVEYTHYSGIGANPTVESCREAGEQGAAFGADFVFGIGGGSAQDAAKAVAVFAANPGMDEDGLYSLQWPNAPLPVVLCGTTSGTGSEVTNVSVLTDSKQRKHSIHVPALYARLAFGDPRYTASMSRALTLSTGIDAFAHAAESYFNRKADVLSRTFAAKSIRMLYAPLRKAAAGDALTAQDRQDLYEASIFGGLAISVTGTCFPHNVGYYLTEKYGIPHGTACAVFHPAFIAHCEKAVPEVMKAFTGETGLDAAAYAEFVKSCLPGLDVRMTKEEIAAALPRWENNGTVKNTPGEITLEFLRETLEGLFVRA